jgi:hypothetical protein
MEFWMGGIEIAFTITKDMRDPNVTLSALVNTN